MRPTLLILILPALAGGCAAALADEPQLTTPASQTVYLDGASDLARLREVNPDHYARAERVLAAADRLCRPGPGQLQEVAGAQDLKCADSFLRTSNPPKRQITFRLDAVRYVALVVLTDDPPRLAPAR
jgi:hypothetical protein